MRLLSAITAIGLLAGCSLPADTGASPLGPADHQLAGVEVCTPFVNLRDDKRFEERLGSAESGPETRFVTGDRHLVVYAGSESKPDRVNDIEVSGGTYTTARNLKVGDPLSRALALYGSAQPRSSEAVLEIMADSAGRIVKISLRCIRPPSEVKSPSSVSSTPPALNRDGTHQGTFTGWGGGVTIKRGYRVEQYPLAERVEYLRNGSPFDKSDLKNGMSIKITVQSGQVIRIEDTTPAPAVPPNSSGESDLAALDFKPAALFILEEPRDRYSGEVFAYDLGTGRLVPVTAAAEGGVQSVAVSPDGKWFAYLRTKENKDFHICVRPVQGGKARCIEDRTGVYFRWRPGTNELFAWREEPPGGYRLNMDAREWKPEPLPYPLNRASDFSSDGGWVWFLQDGFQLVNLNRSEPARKFAEVKRSDVHWIASDQLVLVDNKEGAEQLWLLGTDGRIQPLGPVMGKEPMRMAWSTASLTYHAIALQYGIQGSTFKPFGTAVYNVRTKQWQRVQREDADAPLPHGWVGQTPHVYLSDAKGSFLFHVETGKLTPLGTSGRFLGALGNGEWLMLRTNTGRDIQIYRVATGEARTLDFGGRNYLHGVWVR